ncbi:MAG TPA: RsmE family RNA methyltransferase [Tepidisphaeraceae bacterium]
MPRRIHFPAPLRIGIQKLDAKQAHHLRDVLRAGAGDTVEAFDDQGNIAEAIIEQCEANHVTVRVRRIDAQQSSPQITLAAAVPKGERADWMIEKLSELGVSRFIPLATARSVVLPRGKGKHERWQRIATESAKQSHRSGVMQIDELTPLAKALDTVRTNGFYLDPTAPMFIPQSQIENRNSQFFFIGPEGGWTNDELDRFSQSGLTGLKLTATILRVETAAIATAAIVATRIAMATSPAKET